MAYKCVYCGGWAAHEAGCDRPDRPIEVFDPLVEDRIGSTAELDRDTEPWDTSLREGPW